MAKETKKLTLEDAFDKIEGALGQLESEDVTLEESFHIYQEGMKLLKFCNATIDTVEKKVLKMNEKGDLDEF